MSRLRALYNSVDAWFDRRALVASMDANINIPSVTKPQTAAAALSVCRPHVAMVEGNARLKGIVCNQGDLSADGRSHHWEYFFDLPLRRGKLVCTFNVPEDGQAAQVILQASPFPAPDSALREQVKSGDILHRQLIGLWQRELRRRPILPQSFRDSDVAVHDFLQQGADLSQEPFVLLTEYDSYGHHHWILEGRERRLETDFSFPH